MKPDKVPISDVQTLKFKRDELFKDFEEHPGRLALAREIKNIDDQIAELSAGKKGLRLNRSSKTGGPYHAIRNFRSEEHVD
jgi:hypothetical protein